MGTKISKPVDFEFRIRGVDGDEKPWFIVNATDWVAAVRAATAWLLPNENISEMRVMTWK